FAPPLELLRQCLGGMPAGVALPCPAVACGAALSETNTHVLRTDLNPMEWGAELDANVPREIDTVVSLIPWDQVPGKTLRHWWRLGVRRCWFPRGPGPVCVRPWFGAARKLLGRWRRAWRGSEDRAAPQAFLAALATAAAASPSAPVASSDRLRIA